MRVKDLQEFLSKFTEANATGTRQGNAISNAVIFVEVNGELRYMKLNEWKCMNILLLSLVIRRHTAHRLVMKTQKASNYYCPTKLKDDY